VFDRDLFVESCLTALHQPTPALAARVLLEEAVAEPQELDAAFSDSPGLQVLHHSAELTILHVTLPPRMKGHPHDHRMWAVIGLYRGQEDNRFYRRAPSGLEQLRGRSLTGGETVILGDQVIHDIANPLSSFTRGIHIYGGDFFAKPRSQWDPATFEERPYSVEATLKRFEPGRS
jgi:predicted metal-dependent enzyme (double-stranded beta helix superfamily)